MRTCVSCGNELANYAVYCAKCGTIQSISPPTQSGASSFKVTSPSISSISTKPDDTREHQAFIEADADTLADIEPAVPEREPLVTERAFAADERITPETSMFADIPVETEFAAQERLPAEIVPKATVLPDESSFMVGRANIPIRDESLAPSGRASFEKPSSIISTSYSTGAYRDVTSKPPAASEMDATGEGVATEPDHGHDAHDSRYYDRLATEVFAAKSASAADEKYLKSFSFGPGCSLYFLSRAMGFFIGIAIVATIGWLIAFPKNGSDAENLAHMRLFFFANIPFLIWAGKVAKRNRWAKLAFRDFDQFKSNETLWQVFGCMGWLGYLTLTIIFLFAD